MQPPLAELQAQRRRSLFQAMERFVSAVGEMDGTVMVPSLLLDLPARHPGGGASTKEGDLFSLYAQLKSVRSQIEWGALPPTAVSSVSGGEGRHDNNNGKPLRETRNKYKERLNGRQQDVVEGGGEEEVDEVEEVDVEQRFRFHVTGLHAALHEMTQLALELTRRYQEEINQTAM